MLPGHLRVKRLTEASVRCDAPSCEETAVVLVETYQRGVLELFAYCERHSPRKPAELVRAAAAVNQSKSG